MRIVRRSVVITLAAATAVSALALLPAARADHITWPTWDAEPDGQFRSWVIEGGELVVTNGVYQSRGANTDGLHHDDYYAPLVVGGELPADERDDIERHTSWGAFGVDRWATDGDQELPTNEGAYPAYAPEIAELRMTTTPTDVFVRFRFTSMPADFTPQIATITFAGDDGDLPAAQPWPSGAGITGVWDAAATISAEYGNLRWKVGTQSFVIPIETTRTDHALEARIPREHLPSGPWRLSGGAGLVDPETGSSYWPVPPGSATADRPGSGSSVFTGSPVWSLLFADDADWVFTARAEADALLARDATGAWLTVDPAALDSGVRVEPPARTGRLSRMYRSSLDLGEGITKGSPAELPGPPELPLDDAGRSFTYNGRLQPYGMLVPEAYADSTEPWPLIVYLHGLNNFYYEPFGVLPNLDEVVGGAGYLFAGLLGRGDLSYRGAGETDVLEAIADIADHYRVDPDRIYLMGHSMGSIGTHNVATRNPDLFAAVAPSEIAASQSLAVNLQHVPWLMMSGLQDPLDFQASSARSAYTALSALGYDATWYLYDRKTHESSATYDTLPQIIDLFDRSTRATRPAEFTYKRLAASDDVAWGPVHDHAYAASAMTYANPAAAQQIHVESFALGGPRLDAAQAIRDEADVDEGGPSGRTTAHKSWTRPGYRPAPPLSNGLAVSLDNVASVTLDLDRLGIDPEQLMSIAFSSTTPTSITFVGGGSGSFLVAVDGIPTSVVTAHDGALALSVPAGSVVVQVSPLA